MAFYADIRMNHSELIDQTTAFVQNKLKNAEGGHDWWHIHRVWTNARLITKKEQADLLTVELAALLHDIADSKFHDGDEEIGPKIAAEFLQSIAVEDAVIAHVQQIIRHMSFKSGFDKTMFSSIEMEIVQDADRLDAIGAIGIARAFSYGGFKGRDIFDPNIKPNPTQTKVEYKNSTAPTVNHFYEKLLLLKDKMNTQTGRALAEERHAFMETYLKQFYNECGNFI